jgi:hypothetical protein
VVHARDLRARAGRSKQELHCLTDSTWRPLLTIPGARWSRPARRPIGARLPVPSVRCTESVGPVPRSRTSGSGSSAASGWVHNGAPAALGRGKSGTRRSDQAQLRLLG